MNLKSLFSRSSPTAVTVQQKLQKTEEKIRVATKNADAKGGYSVADRFHIGSLENKRSKLIDQASAIQSKPQLVRAKLVEARGKLERIMQKPRFNEFDAVRIGHYEHKIAGLQNKTARAVEKAQMPQTKVPTTLPRSMAFKR